MFERLGMEYRESSDALCDLTRRANYHLATPTEDVCFRLTTVFLSSPCTAHPSHFIIHAKKKAKTPSGAPSRGRRRYIFAARYKPWRRWGVFSYMFIIYNLALRRQLGRWCSETPLPC